MFQDCCALMPGFKGVAEQMEQFAEAMRGLGLEIPELEAA